MQDLVYLKEKGATPEELKRKINGVKPNSPLKELLDLNESRLLNGMRKCLDDSQMWWTLDRIVNAGLRNLKFVQAREFLSGKTMLEVDKLVKQFQSWGLGEMLVPITDKDGKPILGPNNHPKLELNVPIFDTVFVPLVLAYRSIRWAKLFDERNQYPLYKYSPSHKTTKAVVQTDVITSVIQRMAEDMDYMSDTKQAILQMLDYGFALRMPESAWFREEYMTRDNGKVVTRTQREGVRWVIPRPERCFVDLSYPLTSLNSDTGCGYLGYWDIKKYKEVRSMPGLWNAEKINYGAASILFKSSMWNIYQELFPCNIRVPTCTEGVDYATLDRLDKQFWYSTSNGQDDAACTIAVMFTKINPKQYGLFDCDHPVWMRWLYGDTGTVLYCEPLPYCPGAAYLYDYDANRANQNSLTITLSPFQQLFGNFLTQYFIQVRNSLPRIIFYNKDIVNVEHMQRLKGSRSRLYQEITILPFSKREMLHHQQDQGDAFYPLVMPPGNTNELASTLRLTLDLLERMLGFPSQEVGQAATHEQTAKEMLVITSNVNVRQKLTSDGVDSAEKAIKRILYEAWVNYGSDTVTATVVGVDPDRQKALTDLGFEVEKGDSNKGNTMGVKGKKSALVMNDYISGQEGQTRAQEPKVAIAMLQMLGVALQNPMIFNSIGVEGVVQLINDIIIWSGLPDDFRLKVDPKKTMEAQREELTKAIEGIKGQMMQELGAAMQQQMIQMGKTLQESLAGPLQGTLQQVGQRFNAQEERDQIQEQRIVEVSEALKAIINGVTQPAVNGGPAGPIAPVGVPGGIPVAPEVMPPPGVPIPVGVEPPVVGIPGVPPV